MKRLFRVPLPLIAAGLLLIQFCPGITTQPETLNRFLTPRNQEKSEMYIDLGISVEDSILRWKAENKIDIRDDSIVLIKRGFLEQGGILRNVFDRLTLGKGGQAWLVRSLVDHYLYDLRDRQFVRLRKASLPSTPGLPFFTRIRASREETITSPDQIGGRVSNITAEDVRRYLVAEFFSILQAVLNGQNPGELEVVSTPDQASITIDGTARGDTCRSFVVSPGKHEVRVHKDQGTLDCSGTVNVGSGTTERFCCPRGTACSTGPDGKKCTAP